MQLFYEMIYSCSGEECCKISSKRFEWAKKYFCPLESLDENSGASSDSENEIEIAPNRVYFEDYSGGSPLKGMMTPFLSQPYITCTNLLYAICFFIVQLCIIALHLKRRK